MRKKQEQVIGVHISGNEEKVPDPLAPCDNLCVESRCNDEVYKFDQLCANTYHLFCEVQRLPPYISGHTKWKNLFFHAFSQFDQLWRYQQEKREFLDLRRSQIGEIGSRIAQLYISYYLRTSQSRFVREAFVFYEAILKRDYFEWQSQSESNRLVLVTKKLRALSRAVQASLFLEDFRCAEQYLTLLIEFVERESGKNRREGIPEEYHHVPSELDLFISNLRLPTQEDNPVDISPFYAISTFSMARGDSSVYSLESVVLIGGNLQNCRLLDFTMDHYMMFCFLKRMNLNENKDFPILVHFHKLNIFSLLETLASLCDRLLPSQVMLLYLSTQSLAGHSSPSTATNSILLPDSGILNTNPGHTQKLFMEDLYPFLRKPFLLLIDSPGFLPGPDSLFTSSTFRQPLICLIAPPSYPVTIEQHFVRRGGLLTMFICSPLLGLCHLCGIQTLTTKLAHKAFEMISRVEDIGFSELSTIPNLPKDYSQLCTDRTIQCIIKRFIFFSFCLRLFLGFKRDFQPICYPVINYEFFHSSSLLAEYFELFAFLDVSGMFIDMTHAMIL